MPKAGSMATNAGSWCMSADVCAATLVCDSVMRGGDVVVRFRYAHESEAARAFQQLAKHSAVSN